MALDAFEAVLRPETTETEVEQVLHSSEPQKIPNRHTIAHVQILAPGDAARFSRLLRAHAFTRCRRKFILKCQLIYITVACYSFSRSLNKILTLNEPSLEQEAFSNYVGFKMIFVTNSC